MEMIAYITKSSLFNGRLKRESMEYISIYNPKAMKGTPRGNLIPIEWRSGLQII